MEPLNSSRRKVVRHGVYGVYLLDGKLLLTEKEKGPYKGLLDLPGGKIEEGEHPLEALAREFKEEVALRFNFYRFLFFEEHQREVAEKDDSYSFIHRGDIYQVVECEKITEAIPEEKFLFLPLKDIILDHLTPFAEKAVSFMRAPDSF